MCDFNFIRFAILQGNNIRETFIETHYTYDWMKDETADYKAVKENAENS